MARIGLITRMSNDENCGFSNLRLNNSVLDGKHKRQEDNKCHAEETSVDCTQNGKP